MTERKVGGDALVLVKLVGAQGRRIEERTSESGWLLRAARVRVEHFESVGDGVGAELRALSRRSVGVRRKVERRVGRRRAGPGSRS